MSRASILTAIYRMMKQIGILDHRSSSRAFEAAYFFYKRWFEDPFENLGKRYPELFANGHILDIGANIGYTAFAFRELLSPGFHVYAFEPDPENFSRLSSRIHREKAELEIIAVQAAVGAKTGDAQLLRNENHPGDHRVARSPSSTAVCSAITVPMVSLDDWAQKTQLSGGVSFVKIDVQGFEPEVCKGMLNLLSRYENMSVALEYAPALLAEMGFSGDEWLACFSERNFKTFSLRRTGELKLISSVKELQVDDYTDLIFSKANFLNGMSK